MEELPLRKDSKKKNKKKLFIGLIVLILGALLIVFLVKPDFLFKDNKAVSNKTEQTTKESKTVDSSKQASGEKLHLVMTGFTKLYSDKSTKTFRTDITQAEVDHLKKLISDLDNDKLKKEFNSELDKVEVSK